MAAHERILNEIEKQCVTDADIMSLKTDISALREVSYAEGKEEDAILSAILKRRMPLFISIGLPDLANKSLKEAREILSRDFSRINDIEAEIKSIQYLYITLAFVPSTDFLRDIKDKFSKIVGKSVVLAVETSPDLLGGMQIEYKGRHFDYGLGYLLDTYFDSKKNEILSAI